MGHYGVEVEESRGDINLTETKKTSLCKSLYFYGL